jgi:hypothetical protein
MPKKIVTYSVCHPRSKEYQYFVISRKNAVPHLTAACKVPINYDDAARLYGKDIETLDRKAALEQYEFRRI